MSPKVQDKARIQTNYFPLKNFISEFPSPHSTQLAFLQLFIHNFSNEYELLLLSLSLIYVYMSI